MHQIFEQIKICKFLRIFTTLSSIFYVRLQQFYTNAASKMKFSRLRPKKRNRDLSLLILLSNDFTWDKNFLVISKVKQNIADRSVYYTKVNFYFTLLFKNFNQVTSRKDNYQKKKIFTSQYTSRQPFISRRPFFFKSCS